MSAGTPQRSPQGSINVAGILVIGSFVVAIVGVIVMLNLIATPLYYAGGPLIRMVAGLLIPVLEGLFDLKDVFESKEHWLALWQFWLLCTLGILAPIVSGIMSQMAELASGGDAIARMIRAEKADRATGDPAKRRFIDLVQELTTAHGLAVPRTFVMEKEPTINAFAAGFSSDDLLLAVSRGALSRLTRDELRGVVAYQLAHLASGETRLSIILISLLAGLVSISKLGHSLTHFEWMQNLGKGGIISMRMFMRLPAVLLSVMIGYAMRSVGFIGVLSARLIKTLYSRRLVFHADDRAVAMTGSPDGIGGALRKIGGLSKEELRTTIDPHQVEILSHLFLCEAREEIERALLPAHPALRKRIARIYGEPRDFLPAPELPFPTDELNAQLAKPTRGNQEEEAEAASGPTATAEALPQALGIVSNPQHDLLARLSEISLAAPIEHALASADLVPLLILALLSEDDRVIGDGAREGITDAFGTDAIAKIDEYRRGLSGIPPAMMLPLVERGMPTLRRLDPSLAQQLLEQAHGLILAKGRVTFPEFLLYNVLEYGIGDGARNTARDRYLHQHTSETGLVLSFFAYLRSPKDSKEAYLAAAVPDLYPFVPGEQIDFGLVADAFEQLVRLTPFEKRALIRHSTAVSFFQGIANWEAVNGLRMLCSVLEQPLPDQLAPPE